MVKYISFYRENQNFFVGSKDLASVAVLRSYPSLTYHNSRTQPSAILVEQALIQSRIPFHLVFDEHLSQLSPSICKVLILPNSECLSDDQVASIRRFAEAGGGLIATEQTGLYGSWRRLRGKLGLLGLVEGQEPARAYQEEVASSAISSNPPVRGEFGRGRVAYVPGIEFDGPLPKAEPYFDIGRRFWKRPKNWKDLVDVLDWTSRGDIPLRVSRPDFLVANLVEQPEKRRRLVHLINYNAKKVPSIEGISFECAIPQGQVAKSAGFYTAESNDPVALNVRMEGLRAVFTVPRLDTYGFASVAW